jgi:MFS family permease
VYDTLSDPTPAAVENTAPDSPDGKLLLSVVVFELIGTGLVLQFWVVYLHEVRDFGLDTVGLPLGVIPLAGFLASMPAGVAIVNDLAPDDLRGRYNALTSSVFQLASVVAPPVAGFFIDRDMSSSYIGMLLAGSVVVAILSLRLEPQLSPQANGLRPVPDEPAPVTTVPVPPVTQTL